MAKKKQEKAGFLYYAMPRESYVLFQLGTPIQAQGENGAGRLHFHNYLEIGYCSQGARMLTLEQEEHPYFDGTFCVIPKNCAHNIIDDGSGESVWDFLYVDVERFLMDMYPGRSRMVEEVSRRINAQARFLTCEKYYTMSSLIQEMIREKREEKLFYQGSIKGYLLAFLLETARTWSEEEVKEESGQEEIISGEIAQIGAALQYVKAHYKEPIRMKDLAGSCGLSETHFRRLFSECVHLSPSGYLSKTRVRAACELMMTTSASLDEIAAETGFLSMSTFNRSFRKYLGMSPHSWRRDEGNRNNWVYFS